MTSLPGPRHHQRHHNSLRSTRHRTLPAQDVNSAIARDPRQLPPPCRHPFVPEVIRRNAPIFFWSSPQRPLRFPPSTSTQRPFLAQRIRQFRRGAGPGAGAGEYAVRVQVDPNALRARRRLNEVEQRSPTPTSPATGSSYRRTACSPYRRQAAYEAAAFRPIIVTYRNGAPIRLSELGASSTAWRTTSSPRGQDSAASYLHLGSRHQISRSWTPSKNSADFAQRFRRVAST